MTQIYVCVQLVCVLLLLFFGIVAAAAAAAANNIMLLLAKIVIGNHRILSHENQRHFLCHLISFISFHSIELLKLKELPIAYITWENRPIQEKMITHTHTMWMRPSSFSLSPQRHNKKLHRAYTNRITSYEFYALLVTVFCLSTAVLLYISSFVNSTLGHFDRFLTLPIVWCDYLIRQL